jgi:hypothetical protein
MSHGKFVIVKAVRNEEMYTLRLFLGFRSIIFNYLGTADLKSSQWDYQQM